MTRQIGTRIGAILGTKDKVIEFLGYGTYEGEEIPPEDVGGFNMGIPNPKLKLDSGKITWGCECWWGTEPAIRERLEAWRKNGYEIKTVDIDDARVAAKERSPISN